MRRLKMMTNLRQTLLAGALVFMVSACGFAQGNDNKRPQKPEPPKVVVKEKDPKPPPPKNDKGGKKP